MKPIVHTGRYYCKTCVTIFQDVCITNEQSKDGLTGQEYKWRDENFEGTEQEMGYLKENEQGSTLHV